MAGLRAMLKGQDCTQSFAQDYAQGPGLYSGLCSGLCSKLCSGLCSGLCLGLCSGFSQRFDESFTRILVFWARQLPTELLCYSDGLDPRLSPKLAHPRSFLGGLSPPEARSLKLKSPPGF